MSEADELSLFRFLINNRRFDEDTLRVLRLLLVSKDVNSSLQIRSALREFMTSEFLGVAREIADKTVHQKLLILDFFVRAFDIAGDVESCLALRYEAFTLRDAQRRNHQGLHVSYGEWLTFAEDSLNNGFYSIAKKACENALSCIQLTDTVRTVADAHLESEQPIKEIKRLKDLAVTAAASRSVQAQAADYLKKRAIDRSKGFSSSGMDTTCMASTLFRNGIRERNARKLSESLKIPADYSNSYQSSSSDWRLNSGIENKK